MQLFGMIDNCIRELADIKGDRKQSAYSERLARLLSGLLSGLVSGHLEQEYQTLEQEYESVLGERLRDQANGREAHVRVLWIS